MAKTPDSVHSWKRRWHVLLGGYRSGRSLHGAPVRKIQRMPLSTERQSCGGRPDFPGWALGFGIYSAIRCHCSFVRSITHISARTYSKIEVLGWLLIILAGLGLVIYYHANDAVMRKKEEDGIKFLSSIGSDLYWASGSLYKFSINMKKWEIFPSFDNVSAMHPQDIDINAHIIIFSDLDEHTLKMDTLSIPKKQKRDSIQVPSIASPIKLSYDNKKIAYTRYIENTRSLFIYDVNEKKEYELQNIGGINSLAWSSDGSSLFYSLANKIYMFDIQEQNSKFITNGFWVACLSDTEIGFCRNDIQNGKDYTVIFRYDTKTNECCEVYRTRHLILGLDWDSTGRYVAAVISTYRKAWIVLPYPICLPIVLDSKTGEKYILPELPIELGKSGCILWGTNVGTFLLSLKDLDNMQALLSAPILTAKLRRAGHEKVLDKWMP